MSIYTSWPELERSLSSRAKLALIAGKLNFVVNYGEFPWQIIPELIGFRNKIAHSKNEMLRLEKIVPHDDYYEELLHEFMFADWQKFASEENAIRARTQLEEIITHVHELAKIPNELVFSHGSQLGSATLIQADDG